MFGRILIPTDGNDLVKPAVEMALNLAEAHDATLHALYIVDQPTSVSGMGEGFSGLDDLLDTLEERGHQATKAIIEQARERDIETTAAVRRGNPHDDILTYANEHDIDVIVMGTQRTTSLSSEL